MVLHAAALTAYAAVMVAGTATLIAAFSGPHDGRLEGENGKRVTVAEVVMQSAAERALVSPKTAVMAGMHSNERRGF